MLTDHLTPDLLCKNHPGVVAIKATRSNRLQGKSWFPYSDKKQKDCLETWTVLLIFFLELEISRDVHTSKNGKYIKKVKNDSFCNGLLVNMTLRLFYQLSVDMTNVPTVCRSPRRSGQIKKIIKNGCGVL